MTTFRQESHVGATFEAADVQDSSIPQLLAARVSENPQRLALTAGAKRLSYGELDRRASPAAGQPR
jgi:non-ribosomal peptide synthetase component F